MNVAELSKEEFAALAKEIYYRDIRPHVIDKHRGDFLVLGAGNVEVFVDTGFNGDLSLSPSIVAQADFELLDEVSVQLADGSSVLIPIFVGTILWGDDSREVAVIATNGDHVLGMHLLEGNELRIDVRAGGAVTIESLN